MKFVNFLCLMRSPVVALAGLSLIAACTNFENDPRIGSGPITLSPHAERVLESYMSLHTPSVFVITPNGQKAFYRYCPSASGCVSGGEIIDALAGCKKRFGQPCKVYAVGKRVVWRFDQPAQ